MVRHLFQKHLGQMVKKISFQLACLLNIPTWCIQSQKIKGIEGKKIKICQKHWQTKLQTHFSARILSPVQAKAIKIIE